jgi:WD40 repeat protein
MVVLLSALLAGCSGAASAVPSSSTASSVSPRASTGVALKEYITQTIGKDNVEALAFSPDGKRLALGAADGFLAVYSLENQDAEPVVSKPHAGFVSGLAWSPAGDQLLTAAGDGTVRQSDSTTLKIIRGYPASPNSHPAVAWSPDGRQIAIAQGRDAVQVFDAAGGDHLETFDLPGATTRALLWLPGGEIATSDDTGKVSFFGHGQATAVRTFSPSPSHKSVNGLALAPDGQSLAIAYDDGAILLLDPATAKQTSQLPRGRQTGSASWSPNSQLLAVSSVAFDVKLFDAQGKLVAHEDVGYDVNGTAWSPDGKYLAAGTDAHDVRIWQVLPPQTPSRTAPTPPSFMGR